MLRIVFRYEFDSNSVFVYYFINDNIFLKNNKTSCTPGFPKLGGTAPLGPILVSRGQ